MITNSTAKRVAAFTIVTLVLVVGADFEPTGKLAVSFAYLILLSALLTVGPAAFDRLTALVSPAPKA